MQYPYTNGVFGFNPNQQRFMNEQQQYPQYNPQYNQQYSQQAQQQQQMNFLKGRPVSSFDEAKAAMIDLDGSVHYFTDKANKKIYTKQINLDGTALIETYSLDSPIIPAEQPQAQGVVNIPENKIIVSQEQFESFKQEIANQFNVFEKEIEKLRSFGKGEYDE